MELLNTKLDAVNLCLAGIGREPVASLETSDLDSAMAISAVDRASNDIQQNGGRGWWFNREAKWKLQPSSNNGRITVPNNTLSILEARGTFFDQGSRLTIRGRYVYDTDEHTFDQRDNVGKDGKIEFTLLTLLTYEEMPPAARSAVAWYARRLFSDDTLGDTVQHEINVANEKRSMFSLEMENRTKMRSNYLRDNSRIRTQLGSIGGTNNLFR